MLHAQGVPQMGSKSFKTTMNIVHLEGAMAALMKMKKNEQNPALKNKYDVSIQKCREQLEQLTWRLQPKELFQQLLSDVEF